MRLRKRPGVEAALAEYRDFVFFAPLPQGTWRDGFGRRAPLHVELGCGKGQFITEMAELHPEIDFVGIELQQDIVYKAARKVRERGVHNVRLLICNIEAIEAVFAKAEVDRFYINFCDPWPKKRHAKRRLTSERFLRRYEQLLKPEGELFFKTDNEPLFEFSLNEFARLDMYLHNISLDLHNSGQENVCTEYEEKFSAAGMKIHRCEAAFRR